MDKPTKPTDLMPRTFGGLKENYSASLQQTGVEPNVPVIYHGKNFNYEKNAIGQELDYCEKIADFVKDLPIGKVISTDSNNKLVYENLSTVGKTGSYNDLTNKPTIPSVDNLANKDLNNLSETGNNKILPTQTGNNGKYLTTNGNVPSWTDFTGANKDLSNLSETGNNRLHALKGYSDNGELLTDSEGLADVKSYAHSTFDRSKFTVVGSPTITDDGIASGFSNADFIRKTLNQNITLDKVNAYGAFTLNANPESQKVQEILFTIANTPGSLSATVIQLAWTKSEGKIGIAFHNNEAWSATYSNNIPVLGQKYWYHIYYSNRIIYLDLSEDGINYTTWARAAVTVNSSFTSNLIQIGSLGNPNNFYTGSIDLKQFSIAVDGVEVFNGNKTGIDTIKPDDYTVVGTPTITADGIASGFSNSNYMQTPSISIASDNYSIKGSFVFKTPVGTDKQTIWAKNQYGYYFFDYDSSGFRFYNYDGTNLDSIIVNYSQTPLITNGVTVDYECIFTSTKRTLKINARGNELLSFNGNSDTISYDTEDKRNTVFNLGIGTSINRPLLGSIDLNSFKVYVDGNLVYQPCLKIPYTESKTGSKIVNSIYRDRVKDMAEQFGFAPYYTLSDSDFTLPQGEVYGLINKIKEATPYVVDTYVNGTSWYRIWSNNWCEQGGLSASTTVELLKAHADTNYTISVNSKGPRAGNSDYQVQPYPDSESQFSVSGQTSGHGIYWTTKGYIA